jgi:hypothetical protein
LSSKKKKTINFKWFVIHDEHIREIKANPPV